MFKMEKNTNLDENIEGVENFIAWNYRIMLILEENDLEGFIKEEVAEPEGYEAKAKHKKDMIKAKRIIVDSIKDHLIPQVSSRGHQRKCLMPYPAYLKDEISIGR